MVICFCLNNLGAFGLGATLNSLIKNCTNTGLLKLYFLCSGVHLKTKKAIINLLQENSFEGQYKFLDFDPDRIFKKYHSLQGDRTTYGRLLIADLIEDDETVLYLDSDLVIETDIQNLKNIDLGNNAIGGVAGSDLCFNLEKHFYLDLLKLPAATTSFNAGVLMINLIIWKQLRLKEKLLQFADQYPNELLAADQTLLNGFFAGDFYQLPSNYNTLWYATSKPFESGNAIYHFVGSPKPWDLFGNMHSGYAKWKQYTSADWEHTVLSRNKITQFKRWWNIRGSYSKLILQKMKK